MNESRGFPRFLPRPGKRISITFGDSGMMQDRIRALREWGSRIALGERNCAQLRATITRAVQEELESLGGKISGSVKESIQEGK
jgi:monolysocardiolipin acyltransferase